MRNYIILNDQNSNDISGLLIQSLAPISKPLMRTEIEEIDGRDGDITTKLGYSAYDKQITIGLFGNYDVDQVIAFFNSEGTAIFSNEPDKYYNYQIVDQIDFERLVRYKTATVTMHCQPFKYSTTEGADILSSSDNFATLNQSLNTDSSFYTYSSNVQADITATRQSGTGGKFFAVFTVPVVQGVNYHFSGNVSRNVSMYGYTDQLRGTSAGIAGKGFSGNFVYTATFTGTMVLGFYSNATTEIFIRNFAISNEAGTTISDEGTNLVLEGSGEAPFYQFDLKGNTEQDGTPTPDAPQTVKTVTGVNVIKITNKNWIPYPYAGGGNGNGITFTADSDGGIILNGQNNGSGNSAFYLFNDSSFPLQLAAGTYYFIKPSNTAVQFVAYDGTSYYNFNNSNNYSQTFDSDKSIRMFYVQVQRYNTTTFSNLKIMPMLSTQAGQTDADFELGQEQKYEVNLHGNLYDKSSAVKSAANVSLTMDIDPSTSYVFDTGRTWTAANLYNSSGTKTRALGNTSSTKKVDFTTTSSEVKVQLTFYIGQSTPIETYDFTGVDFYKPEDAIELCKIGTYQDYIYKSGDKWYKHAEIGKTDLANYSYVVASSILRRTTAIPNMKYVSSNTQVGSAVAEKYIIHQGSGMSAVSLAGYMAVDVSMFAVNVGTSDTSVNPTGLLYYALATPTDTEITNEALIEQLNDIADHAHAYKGRTHVSSTYADGNVPHIIAAAVTGDASGTVTNSGNIYSKPKLTIFGTGDIGVYLNGVQMFQIALGTSGYITIDTALMEAYQDNLQTLMNRQVTGDYSNFVLNPGDNQISFTGSVSMCVVENYSRWL